MRSFLFVAGFLGIAAAASESKAAEKTAAGRIGFVEIIGRVKSWRQSDLIETPWNRNRDQGGYGKTFRGFSRRREFVFEITADRDATIHTLQIKEKDRQPFQIKSGKTYRIFNRPVTTWNNFQCSFSVTDLKVDWKKRPMVRVILSAEASYSSFRPVKKEHPLVLSAYMIQVRPSGKNADLPAEHWPVWYVNNWIHFSHHVLPTVHYRYLANRGIIFWSWGVFDPPTNLKGKPSIGVYRLLWNPSTKSVSSVVLHTPGACELNGVKNENARYSKPPRTIATASVLSGKAPLKVAFTAQATDADGDKILWYTWDFDGADGIQFDANGSRVSHTFHKPGRYVVSLTAMDASGQPGIAHLRIEVR